MIFMYMERDKPLLFDIYPDLKDKVPWISLLSTVPTPVDQLDKLEACYPSNNIRIYIKRDDKDHDVYGGNKLRKFEFIFGHAKNKKRHGIVTIGGIGTNHGLACAMVARELGMTCDLFLFPQPLTWHVQRSLLLYQFFGAKLHFSKGFFSLTLKVIGHQISHPKHYTMLPGGSLLVGIGSPVGTLGFINAAFELKNQIDKGVLPEPDVIFVAGGSGGTAAGLIVGCKLAGLNTKVKIVAVSMNWVINPSTVTKNANSALKYLRKRDKIIPHFKIREDDFELINEYLGSDYGIKTKRGQQAIDKVMETDGIQKKFKLETTYTGKAMAAMLDYISSNNDKVVLFWNTYNSNDLDFILRKLGFNYSNLPKKFHQFYENKKFQCWQIADCPEEIRNDCEAYLNHEYRFWMVADCKLDKSKQNKAHSELSKVITLEDS